MIELRGLQRQQRHGAGQPVERLPSDDEPGVGQGAARAGQPQAESRRAAGAAAIPRPGPGAGRWRPTATAAVPSAASPAVTSSRSVSRSRSRGGSWPGSWVTSGAPSQRAAWSTGRRRKSASTTVTRPAAYAVATFSLVGKLSHWRSTRRQPAGVRARARVAGPAPTLANVLSTWSTWPLAELPGPCRGAPPAWSRPRPRRGAAPARRSRSPSGPSPGKRLFAGTGPRCPPGGERSGRRRAGR